MFYDFFPYSEIVTNTKRGMCSVLPEFEVESEK